MKFKHQESLYQRFGSLPDTHIVPDILAVNLKIVFCGTALGFRSAQTKAYYAHPGNFFWRTLYDVDLTPHVIAPADYPIVAKFGLGLTDLCKTDYGQDSQLPTDSFDIMALRKKIQRFHPKILAFTSKTAAAAFMDLPTRTLNYGLQENSLKFTQIFVLPSPSGQARLYWDKKPWQELANLTRV